MNLSMHQVLAAHRFVQPYIRRTPLARSAFLSERSGAEVWLKLENLQPTGSFKVRGALYKLGRLAEAEKARGLVAASAGNHALGLAYAIHCLGGVAADIFVPATAPQAKLDKLRRFPVGLRLEGETYDQAHEAAVAFARQTGAVEIPAYDDLEIITGQATIGLEIATERPETDLIFVPVGGGGMIAGIATVARALLPGCQVVGVQPEASPAALLSLRDGLAYETYDHGPTIADGLAGGFGRLPFELVRNLVQEIVLASEADLRRAIFALLDQEQLVVEASGAAAIAPLLNGAVDVSGRTVVCVLSGGNLATSLLREIMAGGLSF
ncbi:MAG: pyridoxal-phosphate dependent enzyme [Chloroflexi bacterium]|nr:pyridoxal-phosphate dependent enzyme [Chloroflexota bacterium]MCI0647593.1 pyridoxal-phosphate dependent enzyme [Chloroflexota bacterium]MCI0730670.1 pyridoxal-phosphate dependent enzyme [Chloroflexota bacterium]